MKRTALSMLAIILVAAFPVPGGADQLPSTFAANVISNDSTRGVCGKVLFSEPTFVGGVKTNEGSLIISFDFTDSVNTPPAVTNPPTPTLHCSPDALAAGASFDLCRLNRLDGSKALILTITDSNSNGQIDGAEGFFTSTVLNTAVPEGAGSVLTTLIVASSNDGSCMGSLLFGTGYYIRQNP